MFLHERVGLPKSMLLLVQGVREVVMLEKLA